MESTSGTSVMMFATVSTTRWTVFCVLVLSALVELCYAQKLATNVSITKGPELKVDYVTMTRPFVMNMSSTSEIRVKLMFQKDLWPNNTDKVFIVFKSSTIVPQFNILSLDAASTKLIFSKKQLEAQNYTAEAKLRLYAHYIGHARVEPISLEYQDASTKKTDQHHLARNESSKLEVTIVQFEGIWGTVFIVSVSIFMIISYVNLGAQLDTENITQLLKNPTSLILGSLFGVVVMPISAWFVGKYLLPEQLLYRVGSFVFAACPAASASTLWTAMLNSDKELSVGLQVISSVGAIFSMPALLYYMDTQINIDSANLVIQVPYRRLIGTLFVLLVALFVGWKFVGHNERAQKFSRKIFRPLTFFVLLFIVVFSSIIYWHIYQMFDLNIALASFIILSSTYIVTGVLGYFASLDFDRAIAICIGGTYKNSGVAFAVLLVTFGAPSTYIAYVPCLMQIVLTSLSLYLFYSLMSLVKCVSRRDQPSAIQAISPLESTDSSTQDAAKKPSGRLLERQQRGSDRSTRSDENDEFIAMNVTDAPLEEPSSPSSLIKQESNHPKTSDIPEVKIDAKELIGEDKAEEKC